MRTLTLLGLGALAAGAWWFLKQPKTDTSQQALTVVPLPATAVHEFTIGGYAIFQDPQTHAYYARQGSNPYALPLTRANIEALLIGQLKLPGMA